MGIVHLPVMPVEVIKMLEPARGGRFLDATLGPGGHSELILRHLGPGGRVIGMDRDAEALAAARGRIDDERFSTVKASFSEMKEAVGAEAPGPFNGVLMDFGISMSQLKDSSRGFSFLSEGPLDMRMDTSKGIDAAEVVNTYSERELNRVLRDYGEEWRSRRIVRAILALRRRGRIETCRELADTVEAAIGRHGRTHPATKTFQALRIEVNDEIQEIRAGLSASLGMLGPGGRLVTIAYHSLEDREAKRFFRDAKVAGTVAVLTKKPLRPEREEVLRNPSARSARLRAVEAL